jgi:hypothetical protein
MTLETAFSMDTSSIKYGPGVTREVGWDSQTGDGRYRSQSGRQRTGRSDA